MTPQPEVGVTDLLSSVLWSLEHEIAPAVADPYATSLCKTSAALLRSCLVRVEQEGIFLAEENLELRAILSDIAATADSDAASTARSALTAPAEGSYLSLTQLGVEGARLHAALSAALDKMGSSGAGGAVHGRIHAYLARHLRGQVPWMVTPFEGEIR